MLILYISESKTPLSSQYVLENTQGAWKEHDTYSEYWIKNLLGIFLKVVFYIVSFLTPFLKKIPVSRAKRHKRWSLASRDIAQIPRPSEKLTKSSTKKVLFC